MDFVEPIILILETEQDGSRVLFQLGQPILPQASGDSISGHHKRHIGSKRRAKKKSDDAAPLAPTGRNKEGVSKTELRRTPSISRGKRPLLEYSVDILKDFHFKTPLAGHSSPSTSRTSTSTDEISADTVKVKGLLHMFKYKDEFPVDAQYRVLCIPNVPIEVGYTDLISVMGPSIACVQEIKIIRTEDTSFYTLLILFKSHHDCVVFYEEMNGQPISTALPHCTLLYVDSFQTVTSKSLLEVSAAFTELPICFACVESLDDSVLPVSFPSNVIVPSTSTTDQRHSPLCALSLHDAACSDCGQTSDLWLCLVCANVGCGRYAEAHAYRHFECTSHTYCQQLEGSRVWDYVGDGYVHRLVPTPNGDKRSMHGLCDEKNDKVEAIKLEYTCLLTNQLENQRCFFKQKLSDEHRAHSNFEKMVLVQMEDMEQQIKKAVSQCERLRKSLEIGESARNGMEKKQAAHATKMNKLTDELRVEKEKNEKYLAAQKSWNEQIKRVKVERAIEDHQLGQKVADLQDQVNDLTMYFEAHSKLHAEMGRMGVTEQEMVGSHVEVATPEKEKKGRRRSKKN